MTIHWRAMAICALTALALPTWAQTFGEITGRITDASGAAAPDAVVLAIPAPTPRAAP